MTAISPFGAALAIRDNGLPGLIAKAATFTSHKMYLFEEDPNVPGEMGKLTVAHATELIREHLITCSRGGSVVAEPTGTVTLRQGVYRIRLEPGFDSHPKELTKWQAENLLLIAADGPRATIRYEERRGWIICCGLRGAIPPAATEKLITRGWIATTGEDGAPVEISLAGTIALTWRYCKEAGVCPDDFGEQIAEQLVDVYSPAP